MTSKDMGKGIDMSDMSLDADLADSPVDLPVDLSIDSSDDMPDMRDMPTSNALMMVSLLHGQHPYRNYNATIKNGQETLGEVQIAHPKDGEPCIRYTYQVLRAGDVVYDALNNNKGYKGEPDCPHGLYRRGGATANVRTGAKIELDHAPRHIALTSTDELFIASSTFAPELTVANPETLAPLGRVVLSDADIFGPDAYPSIKGMIAVDDVVHVLLAWKDRSVVFSVDAKTKTLIDRSLEQDGVQGVELSFAGPLSMTLSPDKKTIVVSAEGRGNNATHGIDFLDATTLSITQTWPTQANREPVKILSWQDSQTLMMVRIIADDQGRRKTIQFVNIQDGVEDVSRRIDGPLPPYIGHVSIARDGSVWVTGTREAAFEKYVVVRLRPGEASSQEWRSNYFITKIIEVPELAP